MLAYSARNRSASIRIPWVSNPKGRRIEVRFPDSSANPYFAFASMMMAGLDGIQNKIHPGEASDKDLYDLPPEEAKNIPEVCHSLDMALDHLDRDREFLKRGGVFSDDLIDAYIGLKQGEVTRFRMSTHPVEMRHVLQPLRRGRAGWDGDHRCRPGFVSPAGQGICCRHAYPLILAGLALSLVAQSQEIYRWVDKDGDRPLFGPARLPERGARST